MQSPATGATASERLPVLILSGFLGSGKTSLLNALLHTPAWSDSAVVVNEFGDIGLDHLLVAGAGDNIVLMEGGCLCCTVLDSLSATLADLFHRRAQGVVPPFRRVIVETSGLAEPGPIMRVLMRDPLAAHFYRLQSLTCVVDALFGTQNLLEHHEAAAQVAMADRLVVTKTDLTENRCPSDLIATLSALNPSAFMWIAQDAPIGRMFEAGAGEPFTNRFDSGHHHHLASGVGSVSLRVKTPVSWAALAAWIDGLRGRYGADLLRCKGIVQVRGVDGPVIVQGVQTLFDTTPAAAWPDAERGSRLVVIGRDLDADQLLQSLDLLTDGQTDDL